MKLPFMYHEKHIIYMKSSCLAMAHYIVYWYVRYSNIGYFIKCQIGSIKFCHNILNFVRLQERGHQNNGIKVSMVTFSFNMFFSYLKCQRMIECSPSSVN